MSRNARSIPWKFWEKIGAWSLLAFVAALLLSSKRLPVSYQLGLWGFWIVVVAILFRRGWIRLFGPVLFYDLVRTGRRTRNILLRCLYSLALLLVLYTVYLEFSERVQILERMAYSNNVSAQIAQEMGKFAESFFIMFMEVQFVGIFLLTPAFAAGAIAEEKDRRTLEYLLATDLDNREIVLGKLVSRVLGLVLLVLTGLPILSLLQFFGGVDPDLVISGFAATGLTMLSLAGLSILNSVYTKKPRDAIVLTYLIVVAYLGFSSMSRWLIAKPRIGAVRIIPETWSDLLEWFSSGNLFVVIHKLREAQGTGLLLQNVLPGLMGNYALVHGFLALGFGFWAVARLRAVAQNEIIRRPRNKLPRLWSWRWLPVRGKPMLWKELHLEARLGFNRLGRIVIILIVLASFLPALSIGYQKLPSLLQGAGWDNLGHDVNIWVRMVGVWLCAIWGLGILTGGMEAACLPWLMMAWFVYAGFMASLGLYLSTLHSRTQRASIWMLTISVCLYGLPMIFSYLLNLLNPVTRMGRGSFLGDWLGHLEFIAMIPPVALNWLAFRQYDLDLSIIHSESPMGVLVGIAVGIAIWAYLAWWLLRMTIRRFNLQTGRRKVIIVDESFAKHYPEFRPVPSSEYFP